MIRYWPVISVRLLLVSRILPILILSIASTLCFAKDTAGVMLSAKDFHHAKLVAAEWTATVPEYQSNALLRIDFNSAQFEGAKGNTTIILLFSAPSALRGQADVRYPRQA